MSPHKIVLDEASLPTHWYNLNADLPLPAPPLHPGTHQPVGPEDLAPLFPMSIILQEVSGEALRAALERSVDQLPRPSGHFLQTAGVRFTVDPARPPGRRIGDVEVDGRPLVPDGRYRVAVPDYLARGRDGYPMLAAARVLLAPEDGPGLTETVLAGLAAGRSP